MSSSLTIDLSGSTCLITGGSRGIGRAAALLAARGGAEVVIQFRAAERAAEEARDQVLAAGGRARIHGADLREPKASAALIARAFEHAVGTKHLVINAGVWLPSPLRGSTDQAIDDAVREQCELHIGVSMRLVRAALPYLDRGSSIVLVSSTAGQRGESGYAGYAASKAGMIALVRSWAAELAGRDIRVNAVAPGWVETDMTAAALAGAGGERARAGIPLGRVATPADIAGPIVFLLSPLARHMHGSVLSVNGGSVLA